MHTEQIQDETCSKWKKLNHFQDLSLLYIIALEAVTRSRVRPSVYEISTNQLLGNNLQSWAAATLKINVLRPFYQPQ